MKLLPLPHCFMNDVLVVVVAESAGQLLVVHLGLVLPLAPASGNLQKKKTFKGTVYQFFISFC